ncbi:MAG: UDP-N-acetylmuramoyl-L-alanyl-D-glutamate--2,6-diaminopimelate ligase [Clostridia bacterium]|nr:UDP-N-acetylmuramoyl-L-alanyl-D-glutamate--2,6-diaminopimelate ligase [Clostridia bacterium]
MLFSEFKNGIKYQRIIGNEPIEITAITDNSINVEKGCVFFLLKGNNTNGSLYVKEAIKNGCLVIVTEEAVNENVCQIIVKDVKKEMAKACKIFYNNPQEDLRIIGVVGTNGKTTTSHVLSKIFSFAGFNVGVMGTLGVFYGQNQIDTGLTTLGCISLYKTIYEMVKAGVNVLIMEVSAHAIEQRRIEGLHFDALIFTNCTEDHLDYFKDMQTYENVKKSLFCKKFCRYMIVNSDDKVGLEILNSNDDKVVSYGIENPADVFAIDVESSKNGVSFVVNMCDVIYDLQSKLVGRYNVYNLLACCACSSLFGIKIHQIAYALKNISPIEGRSDLVCEFKGASVFIDYAHTPDGLRQTLLAMRKICKNKLVCVFGCGGNREKEKRSIMGSVSGVLCDFTIITTDNPRFENCDEIIKEIEKGIIPITKNYLKVSDRKTAIERAISSLNAGDVLVVAGKGAEKYQEIKGVKIPFSDREIILQLTGKNGE